MVDFSNLAALHVRGDSVRRYTFPFALKENSDNLYMDCLPATEANKPFFNASLRRAKGAARALKGKQLSPELVQQIRADDAKLFAEHVIVGWGNAFDASGAPLTLSPQLCEEFLTKLPPDYFDGLREFCTDADVFRTGESIDAGTAGKN